MKYKFLWAIIPVLAMLFFSCAPRKSQPKQTEMKKEDAILVMVEEMTARDLDKFIKITGRLEGITDIDLLSQTNGEVVEIFKKLGDWIEKGENIGRIDNSDAKSQLEQAKASLLAAEAALESAEMNLQASEKLFQKDLISESEMLSAKSTYKTALANYNGLSSSLDLAKKKLENSEFTAPVSGFIAELNLEIGEMVSQGMHIASIVNSRKLLIKTGVSESDISYIQKNNPVKIRYENNEYSGKIIGKGIRPVRGGNNYPIEILLDNPNLKLYPGMIVEGNIFSRTYKDVLYTSIENLRQKYDQDYLYVINEKNRAERHIVELGEKVANKIIIRSGLEAGDKIAIDGIDSLTDGALVEVKTAFNSK